MKWNSESYNIQNVQHTIKKKRIGHHTKNQENHNLNEKDNQQTLILIQIKCWNDLARTLKQPS